MIPFVDIHTHRFSGRCIELCAQGVHPWRAAERDWGEALPDGMFAAAQAVGETGLDYACGVDRAAQERLFLLHLEAAVRLSLPVVLHCVRAFEPVMDILRGYDLRAVIFHGFIGSPQQAARAQQRGYYLSFGEPAQRSPRTMEALRECPADRIFAETDDTGADIADVYAMICDARGVAMDELKERIVQNYYDIFGNDGDKQGKVAGTHRVVAR